MYVDYSIEVPESLPKVVKEEIAILDRAYAEDDVGVYMMHEDAVETYLKGCLEVRTISEKDFDRMFRRFGWR